MKFALLSKQHVNDLAAAVEPSLNFFIVEPFDLLNCSVLYTGHLFYLSNTDEHWLACQIKTVRMKCIIAYLKGAAHVTLKNNISDTSLNI